MTYAEHARLIQDNRDLSACLEAAYAENRRLREENAALHRLAQERTAA